MKAKHTPGPWVAHQYSSPTGTYYIRGADDARVLGGGAPLHEADARLISAAPELLEVVKEIREIVNGWAPEGFNPNVDDWAERLYRSQAKSHAAVAKAEGRS